MNKIGYKMEIDYPTLTENDYRNMLKYCSHCSEVDKKTSKSAENITEEPVSIDGFNWKEDERRAYEQ